MNSHDFYYEEKDYTYYDTYLGGEKFTPKETIATIAKYIKILTIFLV